MSNEEQGAFVCVHCGHRFDHEGQPTRCPSCMRKGGIESAAEPEKRAGWIMPLVVVGAVLAVAIPYALMGGGGGEQEEVALRPLSRSELEDALAAGDADAELADVLDAGPAVEALAEHATGANGSARLESLASYLAERRNARAYSLLPLDTPRDTTIHGAEWAAEQIGNDETVALYPLELALAAVAALREHDAPAMVADVWRLEETGKPPDPSGQMGYFGVTVLDEGGDAALPSDVYAGETVDPDAHRLISDAQAIAAYVAIRGLHRLVHENDSVRALGDVQRAITLDPRSPYIRSVRGTILTQSGGHEEGVRELEAAANIRQDAPRRNNLAGLFMALGRLDDADRSVSAAIEEAPNFAFAHAMMGVIHMERGDAASAEEELAEAERLMPRLHVLPMLWAQYHLAQRDPVQTERWIQIALERNPRSVQAHLSAAQLYRALGESSKMRRQVREMLELVSPGQQEAYRQMVRARLGASALEEDDAFADLGDDELPELGDEDALGAELEGGGLSLDDGLGLGASEGLGLGGGSGGPSLLDEELGGGLGGELGGLGGGLGGDLQLRDPGSGGFQLRLGQ